MRKNGAADGSRSTHKKQTKDLKDLTEAVLGEKGCSGGPLLHPETRDLSGITPLLGAVLAIANKRREITAGQTLELQLLEVVREYCRETMAAGGACPICAEVAVNARLAA